MRQYTREPLADRFWRKVKRRDAEKCWPWQAARDAFGYGLFAIDWDKSGPRRRTKLRHASIVAWELSTGRKKPKKKHVMHSCDNPCCCNPAHLSLGTAKENAQDRMRKGRNADPALTKHVGEDHGRAKLTERLVVEMRKKADRPGGNIAAIAREYGFNENTVRSAVRRKTWTHVL